MRVLVGALILALCLYTTLVSADSKLGLPTAEYPPQDVALVKLGKALFFDRRLSVNNTLSCSTCHIPAQGFAQNELATPLVFKWSRGEKKFTHTT